jgi:hypothetical protein
MEDEKSSFSGNERTGKTSLVSRLTGGDRRQHSSILEYSYLQIQADSDASYAYSLGGLIFHRKTLHVLSNMQ